MDVRLDLLLTGLCATLLVAPAHAQILELDDEPSAEAPAAEAPAAEAPAAEAPADREPAVDLTPPRDALADEDAARAELNLLRTLEARLSVGEPLSPADRAAAFGLVKDGASWRVRAAAAAVLAWLGPPAFEALAHASVDEDARVRAQGLAGLVVLARRMSKAQRQTAIQLAVRGLDDEDDETACGAGRLLAALDPAIATREKEARAKTASDIRFGCWRKQAALPMRAIKVAPPKVSFAEPEAETPPEGAMRPGVGTAPVPEVEEASAFSLMPTAGDGMLVLTAAAAGLAVGGLLPGALQPPHDTLVYTRTTSAFFREESSVFVGVGSALVGAAALGGAAYGLSTVTDVEFSPAVAAMGLTLVGTGAGLGAGLAFGLDELWGGSAVGAGALAGLALGGGMAYLLPPDANDVTLLASTTTLATLGGSLLTMVIVPVGFEVLFDRVRRNDFVIGTGLMTGGAAAAGTLLASPLLDISHGRVLAASGAALLGTSVGLGVGFLLTPVGVEEPFHRQRIAAGAGLALGMLTGPLTFVFLPDAWARIFDRADPPAPEAITVDEEGQVSLGLPTLRAFESNARGRTSLGMSVSLLGGRF